MNRTRTRVCADPARSISTSTIACSECHQLHAELFAVDGKRMIRFTDDVGIKHVCGSVYSLYCRWCGNFDERDILLPHEMFSAMLAASPANDSTDPRGTR